MFSEVLSVSTQEAHGNANSLQPESDTFKHTRRFALGYAILLRSSVLGTTRRKHAAVWKTVEGPFTFCHQCLLAQNKIFLQNTTLMVGTSGSHYTWSSLSPSKPKCNFSWIKTKGSGFLDTSVPSWMISLPTKFFRYLQRVGALKLLLTLADSSLIESTVQRSKRALSEVSPCRPKSLSSLPKREGGSKVPFHLVPGTMQN